MELSRRDLLMGAAGIAATAALGACSDDTTPARSTATAAPQRTPDTTATSATSATTTKGSGAATPYLPPTDEQAVEWELADPAATGWSNDGLAELSDLAAGSNSTTLMLLTGGRILLEGYFGASRETVQDIASCQKSVISTLVGIARDRDLLALDDPVTDHIGAGWSAAPPRDEARITIRHLLTMSSGLHSRTLRKVAEPGTTFEYNTDAYQKLRRVLEAAGDDDIQAITRTWLFDAIGVDEGSGWQPRPGPDAVDAVGDPQWGLLLRARDMARFGLLALRDGLWGDDRLVPEGWLAEAWAPNPVANDYGYLWWLLGRRRNRGRGPEAPTDWVAALGAQDQKIYVIPSLDVVLTRQGTAAKEMTEAGSDFDRELIDALLGARA